MNWQRAINCTNADLDGLVTSSAHYSLMDAMLALHQRWMSARFANTRCGGWDAATREWQTNRTSSGRFTHRLGATRAGFLKRQIPSA